MTSPEPKLYELWELLQSKLKIFMEYNPEDDMVKASDREKAKNQARGIAEALAVLMSPFLDSADAVVRAAATYYKDNSYEVPGLGTHLWDPLYDSDGSLRTPVASARPARPRPAVKMQPKPKAAMSPADIEFAKQGLESGMFSKEDLASMFKVSASDIEAAIA